MANLNDFNVVDNADDVLAVHINRLAAASMRSEFSNLETLSGNRTLLDLDTPIQNFDCNGADRIVYMPVGQIIENHAYSIRNTTSTGGYTLTIKSNDGVTTLAILDVGYFALALPDGEGLYNVIYTAPGVIIDAIPMDGWRYADETWTYLSASTYRITGDQTAKYQRGLKIKWTQTTVKYGVVLSSSYSAPYTTVTIAVNTDYTISNAAITENHYSRVLKPNGWPEFFNFTPTWTNLTVGNATITARYSIQGAICEFTITLTVGSTTTFNASPVSFAPPVNSMYYGYAYIPIGQVTFLDTGVAIYTGTLLLMSQTSIEIRAINAAGTYAALNYVSSTVPFAFVTNDYFAASGRFYI